MVSWLPEASTRGVREQQYFLFESQINGFQIKPGGTEFPEFPIENIGPISVLFECQSYTCSDIHINKLKV